MEAFILPAILTLLLLLPLVLLDMLSGLLVWIGYVVVALLVLYLLFILVEKYKLVGFSIIIILVISLLIGLFQVWNPNKHNGGNKVYISEVKALPVIVTNTGKHELEIGSIIAVEVSSTGRRITRKAIKGNREYHIYEEERRYHYYTHNKNKTEYLGYSNSIKIWNVLYTTDYKTFKKTKWWKR